MQLSIHGTNALLPLPADSKERNMTAIAAGRLVYCAEAAHLAIPPRYPLAA